MTEATESPTVAVTGAAGYIGSRIVDRVQATRPDWSITAIDNFYQGTVREIGAVTVEHVDIRDRSRLEAALDGADIVMHLAAISGVDDCDEQPEDAYEVNVQGTANVAWHCRQTGAGCVFPFSMGVLGDPESFPITADQPRDPLNWYSRTKLLGEQLIETVADGSFPAHLLMKSNVYGDHEIDGHTVTKGTVINFFVDRALAGDPLTVYEPGTQARNYVHVTDIARAYLRSADHLVDQLAAGETGARKYEIASDEDPSVMTVAEHVRDITAEETGREPTVTLVENPRGNETLVSEFAIDTSRAREELGWEPTHTVKDSIRTLVRDRSGRSATN